MHETPELSGITITKMWNLCYRKMWKTIHPVPFFHSHYLFPLQEIVMLSCFSTIPGILSLLARLPRTSLWKVGRLVVIEERSPLLILGYHRFPSRGTEDARNRDEDSGDKEGCHDCKGEDPLKGYDLSQELADTERSGEDAECEPHRVILLFTISRDHDDSVTCTSGVTYFVSNKEKQSINQNGPHCHIGKDSRYECMGVHHDRAIPVYSYKRPC